MIASGNHAPADGAGREWALSLFRRSVLKQEKYRQIASLLGDLEGKRCLDVGSDNGVVSLLLRQRGGRWCSADLDELTVGAIRELVGDEAYRIDGTRTPFPDGYFDLVVIVDFLEHVHTDREFAAELARILKPGGELIVNVPHLKPRSLLNRVRHAVGLTDEKHGHVRPGYDREGLRRVLGDRFAVLESRTYSRSFSETVDLLLNGIYELRAKLKPKGARSRKGTVVTRSEWEGRRGELLLLSALYPFLRAMAALDPLLFRQEGYKLIVKARLDGRAAGASA